MRVAIFGVTGMIGHRCLLEVCQKGWEVVGISRNKLPQPVVTFLSRLPHFREKLNLIDGFDLTKQDLFSFLEAQNPDIIVNAMGVTIRKLSIPKGIMEAFQVNSYFPRQLAHWCIQRQRRMIHLSTDCVFTGERGPYHESCLPDAQSPYGLSKLLGEIKQDRALILRFSAIGRELFFHTELLEWFLQQKEGQVQGFSQAWYSGLPTQIIAREVVKIIQEFPLLKGLYHISSEPISKYDLLCLLKEEFKLDCHLKPFEEKKINRVLVTQKYREQTGFQVPCWKDLVKGMANDYRELYKNF